MPRFIFCSNIISKFLNTLYNTFWILFSVQLFVHLPNRIPLLVNNVTIVWETIQPSVVKFNLSMPFLLKCVRLHFERRTKKCGDTRSYATPFAAKYLVRRLMVLLQHSSIKPVSKRPILRSDAKRSQPGSDRMSLGSSCWEDNVRRLNCPPRGVFQSFGDKFHEMKYVDMCNAYAYMIEENFNLGVPFKHRNKNINGVVKNGNIYFTSISHYITLIYVKFKMIHHSTFDRRILVNEWIKSISDLTSEQSLKSSANNNCSQVMTSGISLIQNKNNMGPKV